MGDPASLWFKLEPGARLEARHVLNDTGIVAGIELANESAERRKHDVDFAKALHDVVVEQVYIGGDYLLLAPRSLLGRYGTIRWPRVKVDVSGTIVSIQCANLGNAPVEFTLILKSAT